MDNAIIKLTRDQVNICAERLNTMVHKYADQIDDPKSKLSDIDDISQDLFKLSEKLDALVRS